MSNNNIKEREMKYTKKEVQGMFSRLVKAMGKDIVGSCYNTPTDDLVYVKHGLQLDYISCYGGYVIEEVGPEGGCSHPFGCMRRTAKEMYLSMYMATQVLENIKYEQDKLNRKVV